MVNFSDSCAIKLEVVTTIDVPIAQSTASESVNVFDPLFAVLFNFVHGTVVSRLFSINFPNTPIDLAPITGPLFGKG